ncbi:MAG: SOS response-associated peptidase [Alphaproteobacteria bacterium]|nr:SOS response-associated peptidase [Alphaproteobacteria bacterium]
MCNLYRCLTTQEAMRRMFRVKPERDRLGNYAPAEGIWPDKDAPVVRTGRDGERELAALRWGFPSPEPKGRPVTNARNLSSPFWRAWIGKPEFRCLVPATAFAEPHPTRKDSRGWVDNEWFELPDTDVFAFAGVWRPWDGPRSIGNRQKETREWHLFAILTCPPNALVAPIHPKAMPAILHREDHERWLAAPWDEAATLVRPYPPDEMGIAASSRGL